MNGVLDQTAAPVPDSAGTGAVARPEPKADACFHCGEPCPDPAFARGAKHFCCQGCLTVHDLLAENGLDHFYDLNEHPGIRRRQPAGREQWRYLDEPALQQRLLDFTDGKTSRITLRLPAIHCVACVWLLENLFRLHPGVLRSEVNFPRREAAISFAAEQISLGELVALLASIGYEPSLTLGEIERQKAGSARHRRWLQLGLAGFAFGNIMLLSLPAYFGLDRFSGPLFRAVFGGLSLALAAPVLVYSAADYWKSALLSLRQRVVTLDVPIALGLAALFSRSAFEILTGSGEGYLDSFTGLVFFLLCGRAFQHATYDRLSFDRDYKSFFPLAVTRLQISNLKSQISNSDGGPPPAVEEQIPLSRLEIGDRIVIRNGELIPADAKLVRGPALIDFSFVTGESEPVAKQEGDYLYAGGRQIGGAIEAETVKPVSQGYLTSLWNHEAFRKDREDGLAAVTNRVGQWFTLGVIVVSVGAAAGWLAAGDLPRATRAFISVLIVACPCALALAAPFTYGTAQRLLARLGVFLKNSSLLERLAQVDAIVLDKTGTLTEPGAGAVDFVGVPLNSAEEQWIGALTSHSTHPYSRRIGEALAAARQTANRQPLSVNAKLTLDSFRETPGGGIEGKSDGREILLGSQAWLASRGVAFPGKAQFPVGSSDPGGSVVHVAVDGRHRGAFVLPGTLRPEAERAVRTLAERYDVTLLSGDNEREREHFHRLFGGHDRLHFNQSPLDKLGFIRARQQSGRTVMMVGDGLNDAGALKQSDVGVAVVEKAGTFSPACDVILDARQVARLPEILALARRSARIVRLAFGLSLLYNLAGITIAAAGLLSPLISAILMPISSVSVVLFACAGAHYAARRAGLPSEIPLTAGARIPQP